MTEGMRFADHSVTQILVGLHRVGVVGLRDALKLAEASGLDDREQLVDHMLGQLAGDNYIPDTQVETFRIALWRELLRHRGEDCSPFFSPLEVTVRGRPGEERDRFTELVRSVLAGFELRAVVTHEDHPGEGPSPQLLVGGDVVARGQQDRRRLEGAVRRSLTDW